MWIEDCVIECPQSVFQYIMSYMRQQFNTSLLYFFVGMEDAYFKGDRFSTRKYSKVFVEIILCPNIWKFKCSVIAFLKIWI